MPRFLTLFLAAEGFRLSLIATRNITHLRRRALAGDFEAQHHFTQTRYARVFGARNSDLGMVFYSAVALSALSGTIRRRAVLLPLLAGSALSVLLSLYLLWALVFRLRARCAVCFRAYLTNFALFALLLRIWRRRRRSLT